MRYKEIVHFRMVPIGADHLASVFKCRDSYWKIPKLIGWIVPKVAGGKLRTVEIQNYFINYIQTASHRKTLLLRRNLYQPGKCSYNIGTAKSHNLMQNEYSIDRLSDQYEISDLKARYLENLTRPPDGMWESFRNSAIPYGIKAGDSLIGYGCVDDHRQLLQFYLTPEYLSKGQAVFEKFNKQLNIKQGIVGTHNPTYLSVAMHFVKEIKVHTYLFSPLLDATRNEKKHVLKECQAEDMERIVDFCHNSVGAPKAWLTTYIGTLIEKREIFVLEKSGQIIGTAEVRQSESAPGFADIGMIVSPDHRKKGYGTYLLNQAKAIAYERGKTPICSCEKGNIGSLKSITNGGFISRYQLLLIDF